MTAPVDRPDAVQESSISFRQALGFWLRLGFISFGGPAGQISIMYQELVERRRWISERRFLHALNYCMLLPGPEAQQLATYLGWLMHRSWGGIVAGALFVLPSLLILIALAWLYLAFGELAVVAGLFYGIKPAVVAIVAHAAWRIGQRTLRNRWLWAIAVASFLAIFLVHVPFPMIVAGAALIGLVGGRLAPAIFVVGSQHQSSARTHSPCVIDDCSEAAPHTRFRWRRRAGIVASGLLLWAVPMALLTSLCGWEHTLTQMAWFFTKAALLTFGGAYAVLPYVYQGAVLDHGWLSSAQMIDGVALGETTPGPLIMVVAFVAFVGGYVQAVFGPDQLFLAGAVAAMLVTWFTFLPSFVFILAGGPLVESTRENLSFTAPLTAITAAVVGVILSLALFFAGHVFWPGGQTHGIDAASVAMAVAAGTALFRYQRGVIEVISASALLGLLWQLS
jgi:chromate transporter